MQSTNMNTTETFEITPATLKSLFSVSTELQSLIGSVRKIAAITTLEEVLIGLKVYISRKKLFDPGNPFRISCVNDELGSLFSVPEFTLAEMKNFLQIQMKPLNKCNINSFPEPVSTKTISDSSSHTKRTLDETEEPARKKKCSTSYAPVCSCNKHSPMVLYIPKSPVRYDLSDTPESIQGYETSYVKDSTDEDVWSTGSEKEFILGKGEKIVAVKESFDVEYDGGEFSDNNTDVDSENKSDEETDALNSATNTFMCRSDSDVEFWADHSGSEDDNEISRSHMWICTACQSFNKPFRRFCVRCWDERRDLSPENEKKFKELKAFLKRKRQRSILANHMLRNNHGSTTSTQNSLSSTQDMTNFDAAIGCITCIICQKKPANAAIIHSRFACQVACYECAKMLKKQKKRCVVCRRTIDKVVYQVTAI